MAIRDLDGTQAVDSACGEWCPGDHGPAECLELAREVVRWLRIPALRVCASSGIRRSQMERATAYYVDRSLGDQPDAATMQRGVVAAKRETPTIGDVAMGLAVEFK
jgi:hypothetical protein